MSLGPPPSRSVLRSLPSRRLAGQTLWRVHGVVRGVWWFASVDADCPERGSRFDLPAPNGACYLSTRAATAILEAFQHDFDTGLLPVGALERRELSSVKAPPQCPAVAQLTAARALSAGVTVGLWADGDRALTQLWAVELHGSGWQALYHGAQHDPTGRGRTVTLFDRAGERAPWGADWGDIETTSAATDETRLILARHGVTVADIAQPDLEVIDKFDKFDAFDVAADP